MRTPSFMIFFCTLITSFTLSAKSVQKSCSELKDCVDEVSKLTGVKYLYSGELKGKIVASDNLELSKENADSLFSSILNENGYTRLKQDENTYLIMSARDIRYHPTPIVKANNDNSPSLPSNMDYYMMEYTLKDNRTNISSEITGALRPFMSRYGRIIDIRTTGTLVVQDTAKNLSRLYELIKKMDVAPTKDQVEAKKKSEERKFELEKIEAKNCSNLQAELKELKKKAPAASESPNN
jgi:general secretion pathway protein D